MDYFNPDFWRNVAIAIAVLDVLAIGVLVWLGFIDEREQGLRR